MPGTGPSWALQQGVGAEEATSAALQRQECRGAGQEVCAAQIDGVTHV